MADNEKRVERVEQLFAMEDRVAALERRTVARRTFGVVTTPAVVTAMLCVLAPVTVAVFGGIDSCRATELAKITNRVEIRSRYLDRALAVNGNLEERQLVLRYLAKVSDDDALQNWAAAELEIVETELRKAKERIAELEGQVAALTTELEGSGKRIAELASQGTQRRSELHSERAKNRTLERRLLEKNREQAALQARVRGEDLPAWMIRQARKLYRESKEVSGEIRKLNDRLERATKETRHLSTQELATFTRDNASLSMSATGAAASLGVQISDFIANLQVEKMKQRDFVEYLNELDLRARSAVPDQKE